MEAALVEDEYAGMFPVTDCARCGLTQLLVAEYGDDDAPVRRCASCGADAAAEAVRWVTAEALGEIGWGVVEEQKKKAGGCGKTSGCGCAAKKKARKARAAEGPVVTTLGRFRVFQ